jgi:hypothetical protein
MNELEAPYRRALRWYPKKWRAANEDAVIGTLLDQAEGENRIRPARGELSDLRAGAVITRIGPLGRIPAPVRDRAAALAFGLGGGIAIATLVAMVTQKATAQRPFFEGVPTIGPFFGWGFVYYLVWAIALIAGFAGSRWAARTIAFAAIVIAIGLRLSPANQYFDHAPTTTTLVFIGMQTLLSLAGNPFRSHTGRLWIAAGTACWAAFIGFTLWYQHATLGGVAGRTDPFIGPLWQWLYWIAPFALVLALVLRGARQSPWAGAILILLVPVTLFVVFGWASNVDDLLDRGALPAIGIGIVCVAYFVLRGFGVRIRITRT